MICGAGIWRGLSWAVLARGASDGVRCQPGLPASEALTGRDVRGDPRLRLAVDAGSWLKAHLGLSTRGLTSDLSSTVVSDL